MTRPAAAFVYILRCRDGSLYTGAARDLELRLRQHQRGRASRYTRGRLPVVLAWSRELPSWSEALREEYRIKQLRRRQKEALLALVALLIRPAARAPGPPAAPAGRAPGRRRPPRRRARA